MFINLNKRLMLKKLFAVISFDETFDNSSFIDDNSNREISSSKKNFNQFKKSYIDIDFELDDELIYHTKKKRRRLCISTFCEIEIFRMSYDDNQHVERHRCYQRITDSLYVSRLFKKLRQYLNHYFSCQLNQTKRHKSYEKLMSIFSISRPFHIIVINFVVDLSEVYDALITITNKFFRRTLFIRNKTTYIVVD